MADLFSKNFDEYGDRGAAVTVYRSGEPVVDLWGGSKDPAGNRWSEGTTALWMSTTKGVTATVFLRLVQRGLIDISSPVAAYWPEFASNGKEGITVEQVLSHTSGVVCIDPPYLCLADITAWKPLTDAIAVQPSAWEPGTRHGYHAITFGFILDEISRRVTGESIGSLLATDVASPLGLKLWIGLPEDEESSVAPMVPFDESAPAADTRVAQMLERLSNPTSLLLRSVSNPITAATWEGVNTPEYHQAPLTSANAIGTAHSMARMYAAIIGEVNGIRLLDTKTLDVALQERCRGADACIGVESSWGIGYALPCELHPFPARSCFGHGGAGGSLAFADRAAGISFAYLMTAMKRDFSDPRSRRLIEAVYRCL